MAYEKRTIDGVPYIQNVDDPAVTATGPLAGIPAEQPVICLEDILGAPLDEAAFQRLENAYPELAEALRDAVKYQFSPMQIRHYCLQRDMPIEWARWLEDSMRHLYRERL